MEPDDVHYCLVLVTIVNFKLWFCFVMKNNEICAVFTTNIPTENL